MSNVVYDGPGKCRKLCPCGVYLHARSGFCRKCNHEFIPGAIQKFNKLNGTVEIYEKRGKGRKKCPKCEKYVGCRITECTCGFSFLSQPKVEKGIQVDQELRDYANLLGVPTYRVIIAPCGDPPKAPKSTKKEHVMVWIDDNLYKENNVMSIMALKYRLRQIYGSGKELTKTIKTLEEWYKDVRNTN